MEQLLDILLDAGIDSLKILPFLFVTYLAMEALEHHAEDRIGQIVTGAGKVGPLWGGLLGAVPQCGFSAAASNFYAGRVITLGTLIAIFLSTSDEMLPLLISNRTPVSTMLKILGIKAVIGILAGFLVDFLVRNVHRRLHQPEDHMQIDKLCEREHCHCEEEEESILKSAAIHTLHIFLFILGFTIICNLIIAVIGEDTLAGYLQGQPILSHLIAGLIGLIPNCAASVVLTQLYLDGLITFGSAMSGLLVAAGIGVLILFRVNDDTKKNIQILLILFLLGTAAGALLDLLHIVV